MAFASAVALSQFAPALLLAASLAAVTASRPAELSLGHDGGLLSSMTRARSESRGASRHLLVAVEGSESSPLMPLQVPPPAGDPVPAYRPAPTPLPPAVAQTVLVRPVPRGLLEQRAAIVAILESAAAEFGQDKSFFVQVAFCESALNPEAVGARGEIGLFQFLPRTFERNARPLGYTLEDIWDVRAQARVTAFMWRMGQTYQWTCARQ